MDRKNVEKLLNEENVKKIVMSLSLCDIKKILIREVLIKNTLLYQIEYIKDNKAYHLNYIKDEMIKYFLEKFKQFKQILIRTEQNEYVLNLKKDKYSIKKQENNIKKEIENNDRIKKYFLNENENIPFLKELGVMSLENKVLKKGYNKFRQINKYLEIIDSTITKMQKKNLISKKISIVDFACGKSYLSFATYYYLEKYRKDLDFEIVGLDLKTDVIKNCNALAEKLGYKKMKFVNVDIRDYTEKKAHLVFSLHACNNATDYAIIKALELNASSILLVPCCHNEFYKNIKLKNNLSFLKEHSIILEKLSALITDTYRSKFLELCQYDTVIQEFIDEEFTSKNLLIRAIKSTGKKDFDRIKNEYIKIKEEINFEPILERIGSKYIK